MDYSRTESGAIQSRIQAAGLSVILQASNVRKERTGVHATVTIGIQPNGKGTVRCEEDSYNVGRREERERMVNAIYNKPEFKQLLDGADYPKTRMSLDLLAFQGGLWTVELGAQEPRKRGGSLERRGPEFVIKPFAIKDAGTILFAPPGAGKSWIGYILAVCVDAGISRFWPIEQTPALIVNLERGAESVDNRIGDVNEALGQPRDRALFRLDKRGAAFTDVVDGVQRIVQREGIGFVVVDSLSRMGLGKMIDDDVANKGMDALNGLKTTWLVLAHTPRADATHTYGSQMFDAAADLTVQLMSDDKTKKDVLGLGLRLDKRNDVGPQEPYQLALEFDNLGLTRIRRAMQGEFVEIDSQKKQSAAQMVRSYIEDNGSADATTVARDLGLNRVTVAELFRTSDYTLVRKDGKKALYGRRDFREEPDYVSSNPF